ncbi:MAG TPA: cytochrome c [Kiloniellales bacterium]|nr:cytochrome c [Kiloniellales bacterium]
MRVFGLVTSLVVACAVGLAVATTTMAEEETAAKTEEESIPEFTEAFLGDPEVIEAGEEIWMEQCRHCHGRSAYPGKAPKLKPRRYNPEFVYARVTNGFRKMPSWKEVYNKEERMSVTAYVLSDEFSP